MHMLGKQRFVSMAMYGACDYQRTLLFHFRVEQRRVVAGPDWRNGGSLIETKIWQV
jgi:hypothetical protein